MLIRKRVVRIFAIILVTLIVLIGIAATTILTQEERIVNIALTEVNKQLKGEIVLDKSNISLFRNFPYISIALHHAQFFENKEQTGKPLFEIEHLYVGFSVNDILHQRYNAKRLLLRGGHLDLEMNSDGRLNLIEAFNLPSDTTTTRQEAETAIQLDKIIIKDMQITYADSTSGIRVVNDISELSANFRTDSTHMLIGIKSNMMADVITRFDTVLFRHKHLELDIHADYKKLIKELDLSSGGIVLNEGSFNIQGKANLGDEKYVDIKVKGERPDIGLLTAFIPSDVKETLSPFRYDGRIYFDGTIKGPLSSEQLPLIEVTFGCEDAWFLNTSAEKKIDQLAFKGFYTNGAERSLRTSEVRVVQVHARPEKGIFEGNFVVKDFTDPHVLMQVNADLELQFIGEFLGIDDLEYIDGRIKLKMDFDEVADLDQSDQLLVKLQQGIQSELIVENLSMRIPGQKQRIKKLNLHAQMKDGFITLDSLSIRMGNSDLRIRGSLNNLPALLHDHENLVKVKLEANSRRLVFNDILPNDSTIAQMRDEELRGFSIATELETSVDELLHPRPLPKGKVAITNLKASFAKYPHAFHDIGAQLTINDTALIVRNFNGEIDDSDFAFSGRAVNYQLWMKNVKKGKTQLAFDLKSNRLAMQDILGIVGKEYLPEAYRSEELHNVWLRAKADLVYDTVFRFAAITLRNASGALQNHHFNVKNVRGKALYGTNRILRVDTLRGVIGHTDFDVSMRLFAGKDKKMRKKTNYFHFTSKRLDLDEINNYDFAAFAGKSTAAPPVTVDSTQHAQAFNIFSVPFSDFNAEIDIGMIKYSGLWLRDVTGRLRMQEDHYIHLDTLSMKVARGTVFMKGYLNGSNPDKIYFNSILNVTDVDLEKLMLKFDRMGQDMVINKNIKGRLTGTIKSHIRIHPDFTPIINDSKAKLDVSVYQGSLVDFAPMQAMASFFKDKNLSQVRFDTLKNVFTLTDGQLEIPAMNINSSLGFMEISGKQSLDMNMEYHLRIPLKLVTQVGFKSLFGRKESEVDVDQVDAIQYRDKERNVRFLNIQLKGTPDKYDIALGKPRKAS